MNEGAITGGSSWLGRPAASGWEDHDPKHNLDPYLLSALHLKKFTGHGTADGDITVSGELQHPESLWWIAISPAVADLWRRATGKFRPDPPDFDTGQPEDCERCAERTDTNAELSGSIQFSGRRALAMK